MVNTEGIFPGIHRTHPHFCLATICGKASVRQQLCPSTTLTRSIFATNGVHLNCTAAIYLCLIRIPECAQFFDLQQMPILPEKYTRRRRFWSKRQAAIAITIGHLSRFKISSPTPPTANCSSRKIGLDKLLRDDEANLWHAEDGRLWLPLYEGKMTDQYDHRFGSFEGRGTVRGNRVLPPTPADKYADELYEPQPHFWVARTEVDKRIQPKNWTHQWFIGWKDITTSVTERTIKAAVIPYVATDDTISLMLTGETHIRNACVLVANFNSMTLDFVARQKVSGLHLRRNSIIQLPVLPPERYTEQDISFVNQRVLELSYTLDGLDVLPRRWDIKGYHSAGTRIVVRC